MFCFSSIKNLENENSEIFWLFVFILVNHRARKFEEFPYSNLLNFMEILLMKFGI